MCKWKLINSSLFFSFVFLWSCHPAKKKDTLFTSLLSSYTGIDFTNELAYDKDFNIYTYRNFYNGGGVAIGDINNDGLPDIFFTANMQPNRLYLNKGNFQFEDITEKAGIVKKGKWSTGVSLADVNGDGYLDIYVCNSGNQKGEQKENELYINNGAVANGLTFAEKAKEYGLDDKGYSTHASFFDYDKDGDLDMYLLNNSFRSIGSFNLKNNERLQRDSLGGDKLYRNDGAHFTDVSTAAGIYGSIIGFGLGVVVGDVNNDNWPDIYVCNDHFERDYLYINNKNGTFTEDLENEMQSISNASMGADMADINNDKLPDIFTTEMLPATDARLKTNATFENWDKYQFNLRYGYYYQFTRNALQLNNGPSPLSPGNVSFSEISRLAGVHATDWSWGALITDLDNDGWKDIFVANGIYQDITNQDYIQYLSSQEFAGKMFSNKEPDFKALIDIIPSNPISNYAFINQHNLQFKNQATELGLDEPGFSNGSAYGDLDNDGDLDLVVNNVNMPAFVYRNETTTKHPGNKFLRIKLTGEQKNTFAIGTKITVYCAGQTFYQEQMPIRGYQSTVDDRLLFGLGKVNKIDSLVAQWPDGKLTVLKNVKPNQELTLKQSEAVASYQLPVTGNRKLVTGNYIFTSTDNHGLGFVHKENEFIDFDRDPLLFHMLSREGPGVAKADVNGDGLEDVFIGGAKGQAGVLYIQDASGSFNKMNTPFFEMDKESEDVAALFFDADGDDDKDLYVCSGGNEFGSNAPELKDRLYINDGKGNFTKSATTLPPSTAGNSSCVAAADYDNDGDLDLFVGQRLKPLAYGLPANAALLQNDSKGNFKDVTAAVAPSLLNVGMITTVGWIDYDNDKKPDLAIAGEYMPVKLLHNEGGKLKEVTDNAGFAKTNGWWNRLIIADVNDDGYADIIAGNHGLNSRFKASAEKPLAMYVNDFDNNGTLEQIVCQYNGDKSYPMVLRHDLVALLPTLKSKYLKYERYKEQTIEDVFSKEQLKDGVKQDAYLMETSVFINNKNGTFSRKALPIQAQFSPVYGIACYDADGDGKKDIILGGNFYEAKPEVGIYDANYGLCLKGDGKGNFLALPPNKSGLFVKGEVRSVEQVKGRQADKLIFFLNNASPVVYIKK